MDEGFPDFEEVEPNIFDLLIPPSPEPQPEPQPVPPDVAVPISPVYEIPFDSGDAGLVTTPSTPGLEAPFAPAPAPQPAPMLPTAPVSPTPVAPAPSPPPVFAPPAPGPPAPPASPPFFNPPLAPLPPVLPPGIPPSDVRRRPVSRYPLRRGAGAPFLGGGGGAGAGEGGLPAFLSDPAFLDYLIRSLSGR